MKSENNEVRIISLGSCSPLIKMANLFNVEFQLKLCSISGSMLLKLTLTTKGLEVLLLGSNRIEKILAQLGVIIHKFKD